MMKMNIDLEALHETQEACHQELDKVIEKYNINHFQLLYQYIIKEFKIQFIFAFIGMIIVCTFIIFMERIIFNVCNSLFFVLGMYGIR